MYQDGEISVFVRNEDAAHKYIATIIQWLV